MGEGAGHAAQEAADSQIQGMSLCQCLQTTGWSHTSCSWGAPLLGARHEILKSWSLSPSLSDPGLRELGSGKCSLKADGIININGQFCMCDGTRGERQLK